MADHVLTLPLPPQRGNARGHWAPQRKAMQAWMLRATVTCFELRSQRPAVPYQRARIRAVFHLHNRMDDDNLVARLKYALDLLKQRGWIHDDRRPWCELAGIPEQCIDRRRPRLELHLSGRA